MEDDALDRYARHIALREIGGAGQRRLMAARVLVVGAGGLGAPALLYLGAAGVGTLGVIDDDVVEHSNLQRQIIHRAADIGEPKASSAAQTVRALNPGCEAVALDWQLDDAELAGEVARADLVLDCSDNFATRFQLNRVCCGAGTPLVSGAAIRCEGQIMTVLPPAGPCYQCIYPGELEHEETCAMEGVLAPVVGVIGGLQALQAVQVLTGHAEALRGVLLLFDANAMQWQRVQVAARPDCPVCGGPDG